MWGRELALLPLAPPPENVLSAEVFAKFPTEIWTFQLIPQETNITYKLVEEKKITHIL